MSTTAGGHIAAFITILIWGTTFISTKVLLQAFHPIEILFLRFVMGYLVLWCICPHRMPCKEKKQEYYFAAAGLCGVTLYYLLENIALTYTSASNVGVIISLSPFFTALFSCVFLRSKRPDTRFFLGFGLALVGIFLISFKGTAAVRLNPFGDMLAAAAAAVWAAYATLSKQISEFGYSAIQTTRRIFFYGLLFMAPALLATDFSADVQRFIDLQNIGNLLFLGVGASALCFVTWNFAVKMLGPIKTSVYIYIVPVITVISSAFILHEEMTAAGMIGIGLTLAGLLLSESKNKKVMQQKTDR